MSTETTRRYREAGEKHDLDLLLSTLAPDAVLHSPLSARTTFRGVEQLRELFSAVLPLLSDIRYHTDVGDDRTRMLAATARLGRRELEESVLVRLDDEGLIAELTLWVRPLPALTAFMAAIGPALAREKGRPALGRLVGLSAAPLVMFTEMGDKRIVPLVTGT
ncbi:nuclear transport factor 2 family protein [Nonomuraea soli]|uniref:SnoaL-like domain-containing protein n=1 Tax=Nonomuraea soli TaxID=1032476 RepID=A0A7W0CS71_9ACTN|nr:nuclear transport factor 2 family protein [Nonomuraea soli]MBA2896361.1 hypothetical protein [Nonomuraea soli]